MDQAYLIWATRCGSSEWVLAFASTKLWKYGYDFSNTFSFFTAFFCNCFDVTKYNARAITENWKTTPWECRMKTIIIVTREGCCSWFWLASVDWSAHNIPAIKVLAISKANRWCHRDGNLIKFLFCEFIWCSRGISARSNIECWHHHVSRCVSTKKAAAKVERVCKQWADQISRCNGDVYISHNVNDGFTFGNLINGKKATCLEIKTFFLDADVSFDTFFVSWKAHIKFGKNLTVQVRISQNFLEMQIVEHE